MKPIPRKKYETRVKNRRSADGPHAVTKALRAEVASLRRTNSALLERVRVWKLAYDDLASKSYYLRVQLAAFKKAFSKKA